MTEAMDKLRECKELSRLLEERLSCWQKRYQEYQAMVAEFRASQQEFDFIMAAWKQAHYGYSLEPTREALSNGKARQ